MNCQTPEKVIKSFYMSSANIYSQHDKDFDIEKKFKQQTITINSDIHEYG